MNTPRVDLRPADALEVLTILTTLMGEEARSALRSNLLAVADDPDARKLLNWLNDYERVRDWRDAEAP